jgi:acyl-CoA synthetase (AMP-forming)/AMP-acid ligase II/acyl carrier protein
MTLDDRTMWTVPAQLRLHAGRRPSDIAHSLAGGTDLTFTEWEMAANACARGLRARGVRAGDRVTLLCSTAGWTDYAIAWAAVLTIGAVAVPVAASSGVERISTACAACGAVAIIAAGEDTVAEDALASLPRFTVARLADGQSGEPLDSIARPDDDAEIIYTSGTTGIPKGGVATHENLLHALLRARPRESGTVALHALPPGTTVGQGLLVQPLGNSPHRTVTMPRFQAGEFLAAIGVHRPTDVVLVPAMAIALVNHGASAVDDLGSVREVRTTSAPIHPVTLQELSRLFPGARIRNVYSTTECWPRRLATDYDPQRPRSLGRPARGSQVRIVDTGGRALPPGTPGDVQLRGDAPQRRYDGELGPSGVFLDDGWTRTGDVGLVDAEGFFYLVDRNPDIINTGGLNVSSLDVEATLMEYPGVVEAAVCGVPHPVLTECVVAAIRAQPGLDVDALLAFARQRQGPAAPQRIAVLDDLPRNLLGKLDKKQLRNDLAGGDGARGFEPAATPTEQLLAGMWSTALDLDRVSASDDFLQLGGSSLSAMEIVAEVARRLDRKLSVRDVLDTTSLRALAARLDQAPPAVQVAEPDFFAFGPAGR